MGEESTSPGLLQRYPIVVYFGLAFAISWVFWLPLAVVLIVILAGPARLSRQPVSD